MSQLSDSAAATRKRPAAVEPRARGVHSLRVVVVGRAAVVEDEGELRTQPADGRFIEGLARALGSVILFTPVVRRSNPVAWRSLAGYRHVLGPAVEVVEIPDDLDGVGGVVGSCRRVLDQVRVINEALSLSDAALVFLPSFRGALAIFAARRSGVPVVAYLGSRWHRLARSTWRWPGPRSCLRPLYEGLAWLAERWSIRAANGRMLRGTHLMRIHRGASGRSVESPPIVDSDSALLRRRERVGPPPKGATILYLGALRKVKNVSSILRAMQGVWKRHKGARLLLAGAGPEELPLRDLVTQLQTPNPEAVEFLGYVADPKRKAELLHDADALVLASFVEGFPRVIHEAFAAGVPVVAPDLPEIRAGLPAGAARLVDPHDVGSIAEGISFALDPDNARQMVRIGEAVAAEAFRNDPVDVAAELIEAVVRDKLGEPSHASIGPSND